MQKCWKTWKFQISPSEPHPHGTDSELWPFKEYNMILLVRKRHIMQMGLKLWRCTKCPSMCTTRNYIPLFGQLFISFSCNSIWKVKAISVLEVRDFWEFCATIVHIGLRLNHVKPVCLPCDCLVYFSISILHISTPTNCIHKKAE